MSDTEPELWYQRQPDRLAWELDQFARHDLDAKVSYDEHQRLVITTELPFKGENVPVTAVYPHEYPHFEPTVAAPRLLISRHQRPVGRNFCLLEDPDRDWDPTRSAAELIGRRLRALLRDAAAGTETIRAGEADMPEPVSALFPYDSADVILVPEPFLELQLTADKGTMTVGKGVGLVRLLIAVDGIGRAEASLIEQFSRSGMAIEGRWVALEEPPKPQDQWPGLVETVTTADASILSRLDKRLRGNRKLRFTNVLVGLTFLEEGPARGEQRRNWLFFDLAQERNRSPVPSRLVASQALSREERGRRIPHLAGLQSARAIILGAGSLGAPVALELAKAGIGKLDVIDNDVYDANNAVRHVLAARHAGEHKASAVAAMCRELNPFVDVHGHAVALGDDREAHELLDALLADATLIIDTTGAHTVGRFLSERARSANVPLIVSGLTAASYGGDALVIGPDGPCLDCFALAQEEGTVRRPPVGPQSAVTPIGCRQPAFAGAGFEATELAAVTSRLAVQTTGLTRYPSSAANWVVLNFRGSPHYEEGRIDIHPSCGGHD